MMAKLSIDCTLPRPMMLAIIFSALLVSACAGDRDRSAYEGWGGPSVYEARGGDQISSDSEIYTPPPEPEEVEIVVVEDPFAMFMTDVGNEIFFDTAKSSLNQQAQGTLLRQILWLQQNPAVNVIIEGHTDERGTREYNLALGARRAQSVQDFMVVGGIANDRIRTISYGKERPAEGCSAEVCWSRNRRAVSVLQ